MSLKQKYGSCALIAGASEGIGAAFATQLAAAGMDLVLVARRKEPLEQFAKELIQQYGVAVDIICCDLALTSAAEQIQNALQGRTINLFVYNAALS